MSRRILFLFALLLLTLTASGQISLERIALQRMAKGKWQKAEQSLKKSLRKDSLGVEARYVYALWYLDFNNPQANIDSAHSKVISAIILFGRADARQKDRLLRFPIDSLILDQQKRKIDTLAFELVKKENTEESYQLFIDKYSDAAQLKNTIELRDEVSFLNALKVNSYQSFERYLVKYPESHRAGEAKARYEKLLFEDKTKDGRLRSYTIFYDEYPDSPYRSVALKEIFEISTSSGEVLAFTNFINRYGFDTPFSKRAADIAFHLTGSNSDFPTALLSDSLRRELVLREGFLVPFLRNGKYGFMTHLGEEVIREQFEQISAEYLCGNIIDDYLVTSDGLVSRPGATIFNGPVEEVDDLGSGVLLIESGDCVRLIHKSGFQIIDHCVVDARVIAGNFVAAKDSRSGWVLYSFTGRKITSIAYENIEAVEDIIVFTLSGKKILNTIGQVAAAADGEPLPKGIVFDEVRKLSSDKILVRNGSLEGVVNAKLEFVIPLDRQSLTMTSFGFTKKYLNRVTTVGVSEVIDNEEFTNIKPYLNWLGLYKSNNIQLYHLLTSRIVETQVDSLWFTNRLAMAQRGDSLKVIFPSGRKILFPSNTRVMFLKSPDSVRYFSIDDHNKKQIFEVESGVKKFTVECDKIEDVGQSLFLIEQKGKYGLVDINGKIVLPSEYDAVVIGNDQYASLLKSKKFGMFDLKKRVLIKATFERNIRFYNNSVLVAYRDGNYGFIGLDSKPLSEFEFEAVEFWTDSVAMVKSNFRWKLYHIYNEEIIENNIRDYRFIKNFPEEKIIVIHRENDYGVLSSSKGMVIPPTFSDVVNLGTDAEPFYFTEKHVEEAEIFVVIYYNKDGIQIRREIYESDEYDQIYCR